MLLATLTQAQTPEPQNTGIDTSAYKDYKVCMTCGEQWSTSGQVNAYATGQNKSQQRTLRENSAASQTVDASKRYVRAFVGTLVGVVAASVTYAIVTNVSQSLK